MAYEKQEWIDYQTVVTAAHMQHIEEGIVNVESELDTQSKDADKKLSNEISNVLKKTVLIDTDQGLTEKQKATARANIGMDQIIVGLSDPLEAEGNPLVIKPVGGLPFDSVVTKFTPRQEGSGDPYPAGGGKNLLPNTVKTQTVNGVTFTVNADGSIVANGTATEDTYFFVNSSLYLDADTYILNGCYNGGQGTTYYLYVYVPSENVRHICYGNEDIAFTLKANCEIQVIIKIATGVSMNNATFYPMIRKATNTDPTFAPYSNIRPIVPWTELSATRTGKNLLDFPDVSDKTLNGVTWNCSGGAVTVRGTASDDSYTSAATLGISFTGSLPPGDYKVVGSGSNISVICRVRENGSNRYYYANNIFTIDGKNKILNVIYCQVGAGKTVNETIYPMLIRADETDLSYEPYQGDTYTDTLETPVYGGKMNWSTGELTVTHAMYTITGAESKFDWSTNNAGLKRAIIPIPQTHVPTSDANSVDYCSHAPSGNTQGMTAGASINATYMYIMLPTVQPQTKEEAIAWFAAQYAAGTPVQFAYELAEPYTIQCTAHDIPALVGVNTLYGDGDSIAVKGRQPKVNALEARLAALEAAAVKA